MELVKILAEKPLPPETGTISSPGYPNRYPPNSDCSFVIDIPNVDGIRIEFQAFDLESYYDYFYYGVGTMYDADEHYEVTGSFVPDPVELMTNTLWGRFTSDSGIEYYGFSFTWQAISKSA